MYPILAAFLVKYTGLLGADIVQVTEWTTADHDLYVESLFPRVR